MKPHSGGDVRPALLKACYVIATAVAVVLTVSVWLKLAGFSSPYGNQASELTTAALVPAEAPEAPPSPALAALRDLLPQRAAKENARDRAAMIEFYGTRSGALMWVSDAGFTANGSAVTAEIRQAGDWGLDTSDFDLPQLPAGTLTPEAQAEAEIALTLAVLKYARYARGGRFADPSRLSKLFDHTPPVRPPKLVLADIAASDAPDQYLRSLHPTHEQFVKLRELLLKLRSGGEHDVQMAYGESLQAAVPGLQAAPRVLNPDTAADIDRILVNMERWRWMPVDLGTLYVWNNVPEFMTRVFKDGKILNSDRIVAGQPDWPTPAFTAEMKTIVFHPSWGVPDGIKRKELWPLLRNSSSGGLVGLFTGAPSSRAVLEAHKLQVYYNGRPVDPNQVDWGSANISAYEFRQPPGPANVLGEVKFLFPNKHDVYMHDTPQRGLFARDFRGLSHGCMRVGDPRRMAEVLLAEDKGWSKEKVASLFRGGTSEVALKTHIPVHTTYFTAMVDFKGNLRTFGDPYGLDARLGKALLNRNVRFKTRSYDAEVAAIQEEERRQRRPQQQSSSGAPTLADVLSDIFSP